MDDFTAARNADGIAALWAAITGREDQDDHIDAGGYEPAPWPACIEDDLPWAPDGEAFDRLALVESDEDVARISMAAVEALKERFPTAWTDELHRAIDAHLGINGDPLDGVVGF